MRWVVAWMLIGAIVQLAALIELRARWGGRTIDVAHKAMGLTWGVRLVGLFFWPIDLLGRLIPMGLLLRIGAFKRYVAQANEAVEADAQTRCPDCGKPWLTHHDHGP